MDLRVFQSLAELTLNRLGLRTLLGFEATSFEHIQEIRISAGIELIGSLECDAAVREKSAQRSMNDGRADLILDVIADDRQLRKTKPIGPSAIGGDKNGNTIHHCDMGFEAGLCIVTNRALRPDRQIADKHFASRARSVSATSTGDRAATRTASDSG